MRIKVVRKTSYKYREKTSRMATEQRDDRPGYSIEVLEKKLEKYKETLGFIRDVCSDYKDKPALGLETIRILVRGIHL